MKARKTFSIKLAKTLKKIGVPLRNMFGGELSVFLLFLAITFLFWFAQKMGKTYEYSIQVPLEITEVPQNIRLTGSASDKVVVTINGKGMALWKSSRRKVKPLELSSLSYKMSQGRAVMPSYYVRDSIENLLSSGVVIRSIVPDTLSFFYETQNLVKLPLLFDGTTESPNQYIMDKFYFTPDSLSAYITERAEEQIEALYVDLSRVEITADTMVLPVKLRPLAGVYPETDKVNMTICSSHYTEKTLEVSVQGVNFPPGKMLKSFPSKATIVFWVKMSEYDNVTESDFTIVVDYNDVMEGVSDKVGLRIYSQPAYVEHVRIIPQTVEYLVEDVYSIW